MIKIVKAPDPILTKKTNDIEKIDGALLKLIDQMREVLKDKGVGLAAPQVGISKNFAIIGFEPTEKQLKEDPKAIPVPKMVLINPKIVWCSKDLGTEKEGCLSVDKIEVSVPRFKRIHLRYQDTNLKQQKIKAKGYLARVLQHEVDHLNGKLITDYK
jgi:peptide deformylase